MRGLGGEETGEGRTSR